MASTVQTKGGRTVIEGGGSRRTQGVTRVRIRMIPGSRDHL